jgi:hypothetical protein
MTRFAGEDNFRISVAKTAFNEKIFFTSTKKIKLSVMLKIEHFER